MTLRIREARPADAPAIARLSEQLGYSVEPEFVTQKLRDLLSRKDHAVFVADQAGRIVSSDGSTSTSVCSCMCPRLRKSGGSSSTKPTGGKESENV